MKTFNNFIQNTVRGTRNLINNVRNGIGRLSFSKPTAPPRPSTYFVPANNVIPKKVALDHNFRDSFRDSDIVSGNSTYPVVESDWVPMGVQKNMYSRLFKFRDLKNVEDDLSKGNLFLDSEGAARRADDRVLTEADFQNLRPATEVLGPKVFNTNAKGYGVYGPGNTHPQAQRDGEQFLGLINADEAHILAMGGDDIARRIMQNGKPRVLFRRYQRTHPLRQNELNYTATDQQRTPRYNTLRVASNTTGNSTNIPFRLSSGGRQKYVTLGNSIPIFSGTKAEGPHYNPSRHAIFLYNADEYANDIKKFSKYDTDPYLRKALSVDNDAPLLARTTLDDINSDSTKPLFTYNPMISDVGQTLDTGTLFHELMHSEMTDVAFNPRARAYDVNFLVRGGSYIPEQNYFNKLIYSGMVAPNKGYATQRAAELSRSDAIMKDIVVNSIRHKVEALAPKKIPGWFNKTQEERNNIIADVTLDLSENSALANHIMRSWGFEGKGKNIRIPMSYIKINDPSYMYELLRAAEGIRKSRVPGNRYILDNLFYNTKAMFPDEVASRKQILLRKNYKNLDTMNETERTNAENRAERRAAIQVAREHYKKLFNKTWVQTAPAVMAPVAVPALYSNMQPQQQQTWN